MDLILEPPASPEVWAVVVTSLGMAPGVVPTWRGLTAKWSPHLVLRMLGEFHACLQLEDVLQRPQFWGESFEKVVLGLILIREAAWGRAPECVMREYRRPWYMTHDEMVEYLTRFARYLSLRQR